MEKTRTLILLVLVAGLAAACEQTVAQNKIQPRGVGERIAEREQRMAQQRLMAAQQQWRMGAIHNLGEERAEFIERVYRTASSRPALVQSIGTPDDVLSTPHGGMYIYDRYGLVVEFYATAGRARDIRFSEGNIPPFPLSPPPTPSRSTR